jgi:hypothetical protein
MVFCDRTSYRLNGQGQFKRDYIARHRLQRNWHGGVECVAKVLPFAASGIVPSTRTNFPTKDAGTGLAPESGISFKLSFEPDTCNVICPVQIEHSPRNAGGGIFHRESIASFSCFNVVVFPGFILTTATRLSRLIGPPVVLIFLVEFLMSNVPSLRYQT